MSDSSSLTRPQHRMPGFVRDALAGRRLRVAYDARPPYQRNDYIGWINAAVHDETKRKRLEQMLDELERGDVYMKMGWDPARRRA